MCEEGGMKKYQIIYADPPWSYNDKMSGHSFSLDHEYETQGLDWIKALPVGDMADVDSVLFLWAVSPMLPESIDVMSAWGFSYKTVAFCWNKKTVNGIDVSNMGRWTMGNVELCLLGTRGRPVRQRRDIKQLVSAVRTVHSRKPVDVRMRIVELMGDLPRVELFARKRPELFDVDAFDGWDVWGNEVESDIELSTGCPQ
jgi:site-specific DNA-methyltransferase (adenine-specific)